MISQWHFNNQCPHSIILSSVHPTLKERMTKIHNRTRQISYRRHLGHPRSFLALDMQIREWFQWKFFFLSKGLGRELNVFLPPIDNSRHATCVHSIFKSQCIDGKESRYPCCTQNFRSPEAVSRQLEESTAIRLVVYEEERWSRVLFFGEERRKTRVEGRGEN